MNLSFRLCTQTDIPIANELLMKAYHFQESREALLLHYLSLQPDGWWLAFLDASPVGFGGAVDYGSFSYIGMLSVDPSVQRRGIGEALMRQILTWGKERACPTMLLEANEQAVSLYERLGFFKENRTLQVRLDEPHEPTELPPHVTVLQERDLPELVAFDALYFGTRREKIFVSHLLRNPGRAFVTRSEKGNITGYIFAQPHSLGPWVASTQEDAERLLIRALALSFHGGPSNTLPAENEDGRRMLKQYGFSEFPPSRHMCYGPPVQAMQRRAIYGQASMAIG